MSKERNTGTPPHRNRLCRNPSLPVWKQMSCTNFNSVSSGTVFCWISSKKKCLFMRVCELRFNKIEKLHKKLPQNLALFNRRKRTIHGGLLMFCTYDSFFGRKNNTGHNNQSHATASHDVVSIADTGVCFAATFLRWRYEKLLLRHFVPCPLDRPPDAPTGAPMTCHLWHTCMMNHAIRMKIIFDNYLIPLYIIFINEERQKLLSRFHRC